MTIHHPMKLNPTLASQKIFEKAVQANLQDKKRKHTHKYKWGI